tara:strand:- start:21083 stop:22168 length:1086 start_codon:yes stop_codon:yes gene_type:complete
MTTYTHKKSLRHITDEQFSEKTTVDGSRIDKALAESVDHVNSIPAGDVLSRYTESKFVFGYRPNRDYDACYTSTASGSSTISHYYAHHFPWMQIANNSDLTLGAAQDAQNPYVVKTVGLSDKAGSGYGISNVGPIAYDDPAGTADWVNDWNQWAAASTTQGTKDYTTLHGPFSGYQYAYTNSWNFNKPAVIDDLMVSFTIDGWSNIGYTPLVAGMYSKFEGPSGVYGTDTVGVVLMVDNHFSQELREDSEIEIAANRYDLRGFKYTYAPMSTISDMSPTIFSPTQVAPAGQVNSVVMRWRDLNIPLHENARVRLSITLPWTKGGGQPGGLTWETGGAEVATAPFYYSCPRGCMTVLEELVP